MRFVDHDPAAARAAALHCRDAAHAYALVAAGLARDAAAVRWWGPERDRVVAALDELAADLHREAAALRASAERLAVAARRAEAVDEQRRALANSCSPSDLR